MLQDRARWSGEGQPDADTRARIRARLLAVRERRERPALDDKRLTSWNALMIAALADAGAAVGAAGEAASGQRYLDAAVACADFLLATLRDPDGRLLRSYSDGRARIDAYLEDHAFLLEALIVLFEASCEERWLTEASALADTLIARFADPERGGFFSTAADGEVLIARRKELEDSPIPAGGSSAALGLLRLHQLTGREEYEQHAVSVLRLVHELAPRYPTAFGHLLQALHWYFAPARPIACALPPSVRGPVDVGGGG